MGLRPHVERNRGEKGEIVIPLANCFKLPHRPLEVRLFPLRDPPIQFKQFPHSFVASVRLIIVQPGNEFFGHSLAIELPGFVLATA